MTTQTELFLKRFLLPKSGTGDKTAVCGCGRLNIAEKGLDSEVLKGHRLAAETNPDKYVFHDYRTLRIGVLCYGDRRYVMDCACVDTCGELPTLAMWLWEKRNEVLAFYRERLDLELGPLKETEEQIKAIERKP